MKQNDTKTEPAGARTQPEQCPKCKTALRYYDGCMGYEAMRCDTCGYERDLNEAANAKATAEREAREKKALLPRFAKGKARIRQNVWGNINGYVGTRKVEEFGTREDEARAWLTQQTGLPAPSGTVKQGRRPMFQPFKKPDKWASLIEACEMGSESGAETVRKYLEGHDELLAALRSILAQVDSPKYGKGFPEARAAIANAERRTK